MRVHDLAVRAGVAPHVVRYYTQRELLRPERNESNQYRMYSDSDLYRLRFICRAKRVGFTLSDIKMILHDAEAGVMPCPQVRDIIRKRTQDNEKRLEESMRLQRRMSDAIATWNEIPDQPPDHRSLCRLIDAVAIEETSSGAIQGAEDRVADR